MSFFVGFGVQKSAIDRHFSSIDRTLQGRHEDDEEKKANFEGVSSRIGIGIWRDFDNDDGARDRVRRVSRQLLSQGRFSFFDFFFVSLVTWRRM